MTHLHSHRVQQEWPSVEVASDEHRYNCSRARLYLLAERHGDSPQTKS